jgi:hypothetical protein
MKEPSVCIQQHNESPPDQWPLANRRYISTFAVDIIDPAWLSSRRQPGDHA